MKKQEKEAERIYNEIAEYYHNLRTTKNPQGWFYNELLEMPATFELLGNVKGKKILDFGCGSGIYMKELTKKGANVKGFDISKKMIEIARKNNLSLEIKKGSGNKIPFKEKFDIVIASLVLDYFKDWNKPFNEVSKKLKKGGLFIFSIGNPIVEIVEKKKINGRKRGVLGIKDYFSEKLIYGNWKSHDSTLNINVPSYHKTYETIIKIILENNFEITGYKDTKPLKKANKLFPEEYEKISKIPYFSVWRVRKK